MKKFIAEVILSNGKLPAKRNLTWLLKSGYSDQHSRILKLTNFLDDECKLNQRLWHILNDKYENVSCVVCGGKVRFRDLKFGYFETCCNSCAQKNPSTIDKIKKTNLKNLGHEYPMQSKNTKEKSKQSCINKYGVDNVSKSEKVKLKKEDTCLKNHGVKYYLERQDLKESHIRKKYGVDNIQKVQAVKDKTSRTRRSEFYELIISGNRLQNLSIPLFSKNDYVSNGYYKSYNFQCSSCRKVFSDCLEDGDVPKCPECYPKKSKFELEVAEYLESLNVSILKNDRNIISPLELDILIPDRKIAIECNGLYWHSEKNGKDKNYHLHKTVKCSEVGYKLIHIFEDEWVLKRDIVKRILANKLKQNTNKIYARSCTIVELQKDDCGDFLNKYHLQGNDNSKYKYGLYHNDELVSVMTFGKHRFSSGSGFEIYRYCTNSNVVGGAKKLLSHFVKLHTPNKIVSYCDRRYFDGEVYKQLNFKKTGDTVPGYWYFNRKKYYRQHRFNFRKSALPRKLSNFDPKLTEYQNMINNGYDRIWDCGNFKFECIL